MRMQCQYDAIHAQQCFKSLHVKRMSTEMMSVALHSKLTYDIAVVSRHSVTSYVFTCCTTEAILVHCSQYCVIRQLPYTHGTAAI